MSSNSFSEQELAELNKLHEHAKNGNHYGLLGLAPDADTAKIQAAYYQLSRDWHPDRHYRRNIGDSAEKLEFVFVHINKAYKTLKNDDLRRRYHRDNKSLISIAREEAKTNRQASDSEPRKKPDPERRKKSRKRAAAEKAARERMSQRRADPRARAIKQLRAQVKGRSSRAKRYFKQGEQDYKAGNIAKAVSSLHLAVQFEPQNTEFRALYELARSEASSSLSVQYVQAGESAESFQNYREAMHNYQRACEQNPDAGLPFYRLATLILKIEQDNRKALGHLRTAATKSPKNIEIRLALADLYAELGMGLNARREYQTVLETDKNNARARSGIRNVR